MRCGLPNELCVFYSICSSQIDASNGKQYSFRDLETIIRKVAQSLFHDVGLRRGDVVLILSNNRAEYVFVLLAAALVGVVVSTASPLYTTGTCIRSFNLTVPILIFLPFD